jgi:hypothetical protein
MYVQINQPQTLTYNTEKLRSFDIFTKVKSRHQNNIQVHCSKDWETWMAQLLPLAKHDKQGDQVGLIFAY